uniref:AN1-type domain-containing protein n=1 Tax=Panagrolaimus sp. JU765 TaxID=591449 RepID=A0AC34PXJ1_9BILA
MLGEYGMQADCVVKLAPRMASGTRRQADSQVILLIPDVIPKSVKTVADLRETIKTLHTSLPSNEPQDRSSALWTPEKQMEHELTRNRMKELMQRRRKLRPSPKSSSSSSIVAPEFGDDLNGVSGMPLIDTGSICGSIGRSPLASEPGTPPELRANRGNMAKQNVSSTTVVEPKDPATIPVTEKELKLYFDPPETTRQAEMLRRDLYDPPQNRQELEKVKKDLQELQKGICGVCRRRLPLIQQSLKCRCGRSFCPRHRNAEEHKCSVDYKLAGRKKLEKENPKLELGGARKAKQDEV